MRPSTIFFDLDETLIDHSHATRMSARSFRNRHREFFDALSPSAFDFVWMDLVDRAYDRYITGKDTLNDARRWRMKTLFQSVGRDISDRQADGYACHAVECYENNWRLFEDAIPCLRELANTRLGIITNGSTEQQQRKLHQMGIQHFFSTVIVSESAKIAKPDPGIFLAACESAGTPPHRCIHIGDRIRTDAMGAISAGLTGIWLNRNGVRCLPDAPSSLLEIKTLDKLRSMLDKRIIQGASNEKFRHL